MSINSRIDEIDRVIVQWMAKYGILILRIAMAIIFIWFGIQKPLGISPAAPLVEMTVTWIRPEVFVPILGWWEVLIGVCLLYRPLIRLALILLAGQMAGAMSPLVLLPQGCWTDFPYALTLEGQYIVKNLVLIGAAIVIGGTARTTSTPARKL